MTDPQVIEDAVVRGKAFMAEIVHNEIFKAQIGVDECDCEVDSECLLFILKALDYRIENDKFDDITESLYRCLIMIIGDYTPQTIVKFYYGFKDTAADLTEADILAALFVNAPSGSNPTIPFPISGTPKYFWMAELSTEPLKTKWQDTVVSFNAGNIGTGTDLFGAPVTVSIFRTYDTVYPTQFQYPIQFKVI